MSTAILPRSPSFSVVEDHVETTASQPLINLDELPLLTKEIYTEDKEYLRNYHRWRKTNELLYSWYRRQTLVPSSVFSRSSSSSSFSPQLQLRSSSLRTGKTHEPVHRTERSASLANIYDQQTTADPSSSLSSTSTVTTIARVRQRLRTQRRKSAVDIRSPLSSIDTHPTKGTGKETIVASLLKQQSNHGASSSNETSIVPSESFALLTAQELVEAVPVPHVSSSSIVPSPLLSSNDTEHTTATGNALPRRYSLSRPITAGVSLSRPGSSNNLHELLQQEQTTKILENVAIETYVRREQAVSKIDRKKSVTTASATSDIINTESAKPFRSNGTMASPLFSSSVPDDRLPPISPSVRKPFPQSSATPIPSQRRNSTLALALDQRYLPDITSPRTTSSAQNSNKPVVRKVHLHELYRLYPYETIEKYYTEKAILKRESIRYHPAVVMCTKAMWKIYTKALGVRMHKDGYMLLFGHAQRIMRNVMDSIDSATLFGNNNGNENSTLTALSMKNFALEKDWIEDSEGSDTMDYPQFAFAWFQIADLWTDEVHPLVYAILLNKLYISMTCIIKTNGSGGGGKKTVEPPHPLQTLDMSALLTLEAFPSDYFTPPDPDNREFAFIYQHIPRYISPEEIERFRRMKEERQALIRKKLLERKGLGSDRKGDEIDPYSGTRNLTEEDTSNTNPAKDQNYSSLRNRREQVPAMYEFDGKRKRNTANPRYHAQRISLRGMEMMVSKVIRKRMGTNGNYGKTELVSVLQDDTMILQRMTEPLYFLNENNVSSIVERTVMTKYVPEPFVRNEGNMDVDVKYTKEPATLSKRYTDTEIQTTPRLFLPLRTCTSSTSSGKGGHGDDGSIPSNFSKVSRGFKPYSPPVSVSTVNTKDLRLSSHTPFPIRTPLHTATTGATETSTRTGYPAFDLPVPRTLSSSALSLLRPITQPVILRSYYSSIRSDLPSHPGTASSFASLFVLSSCRTGTATSSISPVDRKNLFTRETAYSSIVSTYTVVPKYARIKSTEEKR